MIRIFKSIATTFRLRQKPTESSLEFDQAVASGYFALRQAIDEGTLHQCFPTEGMPNPANLVGVPVGLHPKDTPRNSG